MTKEKLPDGNEFYSFIDGCDCKCVLYKSNIQDQMGLVVGMNDLNTQVMTRGGQISREYRHEAAILLKVEDAKKLLPILQEFVDTGEI